MCNHKKIYSSGITLTSYPLQHIQKWICELCGEEGEDRTQGTNLYEETRSKFGKGNRIDGSSTSILGKITSKIN